MKSIISRAAFAAWAALAFACGDVPEDGLGFEDVEEEEFGQIEQGFTGKVTPSFQHGTQTGGGRNQCDRTSAGQVCSVPAKKNWTYCIAMNLPGSVPNGRTAATRSRISAMFASIDSAYSGWGFTEVLDFLNGCPTSGSNPADIVVHKNPVGSSGTGSSDVKDYATISFGTTASLTEGTGVVGSYQSHGFCSITLDDVDILAKGSNATQDNNGIDHAAAHELLACMGIGARAVSGNRASRQQFDPSTVATARNSGEDCMISNYLATANGQYNNDTFACSN